MKVIRRKTDKTIVFSGEDIHLDQNGASGNGWRSRKITTADYELLTIDGGVPDGFSCGKWMYDGGNWSVTDDAKAELLQFAKETKKKLLNAKYKTALESDIDYNSKTYSATKERRELLSEILSVGSVPEGMYLIDINGDQNAMTYADIQAIAQALLARGLTANANLKTKLDAVEAATDVASVEAVTW